MSAAGARTWVGNLTGGRAAALLAAPGGPPDPSATPLAFRAYVQGLFAAVQGLRWPGLNNI